MPLDRRQAHDWRLPVSTRSRSSKMSATPTSPGAASAHPRLRALDAGGGQVIYCGSFSKSIAPALTGRLPELPTSLSSNSYWR